jgi:hypothetical protein
MRTILSFLIWPWILWPLGSLGQEQRVFRDWVASCDNTRHCTLIGLSLVDAERFAHLRFERSGEPTAWIESMRFDLGDLLPAGGEWSLWADETQLFPIREDERRCGEPFPPDLCYAVVLQDEARKRGVFEQLRRADVLTLVVDDQVLAGVSLDGASAALLWVDDRQGRVGSETAFVRPGAKPASELGAAPSPPLVQIRKGAWQALEEAEVETSAAEIAPALLGERCDRAEQTPAAEEGFSLLRDEGWKDEEGRVLMRLFCYAGAYNFMSLWFLRAPGGGWEEVDFARPTRAQGEGQGELVNASFDPAAGLIESFSKGRGLGDCGENGVWGWNGERFVLLELRALWECRGVGADAWPVLYRARRE